jgi:ATPase family associated with various cellular activities (AAA)
MLLCRVIGWEPEPTTASMRRGRCDSCCRQTRETQQNQLTTCQPGVAREVVGEFTVIYVEAKAGAELLTAVVEEAQRLGGPVLIVLEDVDLWCRNRKTGGAGLSELLQAMDIQPDARILTLASTNDAATLDRAGSGRYRAEVPGGMYL